MYMPPPPPLQLSKAEAEKRLAALKCENVDLAALERQTHPSMADITSPHLTKTPTNRSKGGPALRKHKSRPNDVGATQPQRAPAIMHVPASTVSAVPTFEEILARKTAAKMKNIKAMLRQQANFSERARPAPEPPPQKQEQQSTQVPPRVPPKTLLSGPPSMYPAPTAPLPPLPFSRPSRSSSSTTGYRTMGQVRRSRPQRMPTLERTSSHEASPQYSAGTYVSSDSEMCPLARRPLPQRSMSTPSLVESVEKPFESGPASATSSNSTYQISDGSWSDPRDSVLSPYSATTPPRKSGKKDYHYGSPDSYYRSPSSASSDVSRNAERPTSKHELLGDVPWNASIWKSASSRQIHEAPDTLANPPTYELACAPEFAPNQGLKPAPPFKQHRYEGDRPQLSIVTSSREFYKSGWPRRSPSSASSRRTMSVKARSNQQQHRLSASSQSLQPSNSNGNISDTPEIAVHDDDPDWQPESPKVPFQMLDAISEKTSIAEDLQIEGKSSDDQSTPQQSFHDHVVLKATTASDDPASDLGATKQHKVFDDNPSINRHSHRASRRISEQTASSSKPRHNDDVMINEICAYFDNHTLTPVYFDHESRLSLRRNASHKSNKLQQGQPERQQSPLRIEHLSPKGKAPTTTYSQQATEEDERPPVPPKKDSLRNLRPSTAPAYQSASTCPLKVITHQRSLSEEAPEPTPPYCKNWFFPPEPRRQRQQQYEHQEYDHKRYEYQQYGRQQQEHQRHEHRQYEHQQYEHQQQEHQQHELQEPTGDQGFDWSDDEQDPEEYYHVGGEQLSWFATAARLRKRGAAAADAGRSRRAKKGAAKARK